MSLHYTVFVGSPCGSNPSESSNIEKSRCYVAEECESVDILNVLEKFDWLVLTFWQNVDYGTYLCASCFRYDS